MKTNEIKAGTKLVHWHQNTRHVIAEMTDEIVRFEDGSVYPRFVFDGLVQMRHYRVIA